VLFFSEHSVESTGTFLCLGKLCDTLLPMFAHCDILYELFV